MNNESLILGQIVSYMGFQIKICVWRVMKILKILILPIAIFISCEKTEDELTKYIWQKYLGGNGYDGAKSIQQTTNGDYIIAGSSRSNSGHVSGNHGKSDCWIVKIAEN